MVRLADLEPAERAHALAKRCEPVPGTPFVRGPGLEERRIALVTTAGLHRREDPAFGTVPSAYRVIPGAGAASDRVISIRSNCCPFPEVISFWTSCSSD